MSLTTMNLARERKEDAPNGFKTLFLLNDHKGVL